MNDLRTATGIDHRHQIWQRRGLHIAPTPDTAVAFMVRNDLLTIEQRYSDVTCRVFSLRLINNGCVPLVAGQDPVYWAKAKQASLLYVLTLDSVDRDHRWWSPWWCECYEGVDGQRLKIAIIDVYSGEVIEQLVVNTRAGWLDDDDPYVVYAAALEAALYTMAPNARHSKIRWSHSH